jgi:acyl carrier protein
MNLSNRHRTHLGASLGPANDTDDVDHLVLDVVATHMLMETDELTPSLRVRDDLDLDPLDLVLIALRLEDALGVEFPIGQLENVASVGDFAIVLRRLLRNNS